MASEISKFFGDPDWWFSAVLTAIVVNLVSALLYDKLKALIWSITFERFLIICQLAFAALICASCFLITSDDFYIKNILPALGIFLPFLVVADMYLKQKYRFLAMITVICMFSIVVSVEMYLGHATYTADWLARQFLSSLFLGSGISVITTSILRIRASKNYSHR